MPLPRRLPFALGLVLLLSACPSGSKGGGGADAGGPQGNDGGQVQGDGGGGGGGTDGGVTDGGNGSCTPGLGQCGAGKYCDATGACVAGGQCDPAYGNSNCNYPSDGAGCGGATTEDCYCDPGDKSCKPRLALCQTCMSDAQCGSNPNYFTEPRSCTSFNGSKVCLTPAGQQACPRGYQPDTTGTWCVPNSGACGTATVCNSDADCPAATPICNKSSGTCKDACVFDLKTGDSSCPTGQVCDEDGHCRAPCDPTNDQCSKLDPSYVCKQDTGGVYRCRISGCLGDSECPVDPTTPYVAYCDLNAHQCVSDSCRSDADCKSGNACNTTNKCVAMTCKQRGGTALSCGLKEYCCDDPIPCDGSETPATDGLQGCVMAPNPPWCQSCSQRHRLHLPVSPHKDDPRDKNLCFSSKCANTCATADDCPRGWSCMPIEAGCDPTQQNQCGTAGQCVDDGQFGKACTQASDCGSGSNVSCKPNPSDGNKMECYTAMNVCSCADASGAPQDANCPSGDRCAQIGVNKYRCVQSKVCIDSPGTCK